MLLYICIEFCWASFSVQSDYYTQNFFIQDNKFINPKISEEISCLDTKIDKIRIQGVEDDIRRVIIYTFVDGSFEQYQLSQEEFSQSNKMLTMQLTQYDLKFCNYFEINWL